jgi:uncharacterized protein (TIGR03067 family)
MCRYCCYKQAIVCCLVLASLYSLGCGRQATATFGKVGASIGATTPKDVQVEKEKDDAKNLQGEWKMVKIQVNDAEVMIDAPPGVGDPHQKVTIKDDKVAYNIWVRAPLNFNIVKDGAFKLDTKQDPKAIDMTFKHEKVVRKGIYALDGDNLKIAYILPNDNINDLEKEMARPKGFDSRDPNGILFTFTTKREGKK